MKGNPTETSTGACAVGFWLSFLVGYILWRICASPNTLQNYEKTKEEYKNQAGGYRMAKKMPWRTHAEVPTAEILLANVSGKKVVDLASGDGFYSRIIKELGADTVVGVDLSEAMIAIAREEEEKSSLNISYVCSNVASWQTTEKFDVAFAGYLLNYARSYEQLEAMLRSVARMLKPDGIFVGFNANPLDVRLTSPHLAKYGIAKEVRDRILGEGSEIKYTFSDQGEDLCQITNYFMPYDRMRQAFFECGFRGFELLKMRVSAKAIEDYPVGYWDELINDPTVIGFKARLERDEFY